MKVYAVMMVIMVSFVITVLSVLNMVVMFLIQRSSVLPPGQLSMGHNSNSDIFEGYVSGGGESRDSLIDNSVHIDVNVLSCNYECLSVDNYIVESAAINSPYISRSDKLQGHMYDVSIAQKG